MDRSCARGVLWPTISLNNIVCQCSICDHARRKSLSSTLLRNASKQARGAFGGRDVAVDRGENDPRAPRQRGQFAGECDSVPIGELSIDQRRLDGSRRSAADSVAETLRGRLIQGMIRAWLCARRPLRWAGFSRLVKSRPRPQSEAGTLRGGDPQVAWNRLRTARRIQLDEDVFDVKLEGAAAHHEFGSMPQHNRPAVRGRSPGAVAAPGVGAHDKSAGSGARKRILDHEIRARPR
jgi:hypothetical protein